MTCVLKVVVAVAFIAASKRCNGRAEDSDRTPNEFQKFWTQNNNVLRLRSTNGNFGSVRICTWYRPMNCDDIGVTVSKWVYFIEQNQTRDYSQWPQYWKFGANDSMWRVEGDGMEEQYMLFQEIDSSCAVIQSQYYIFAEDELKDQLVQECNAEPESPRCKIQPICVPHTTGEYKYRCRDHTNYDLLVSKRRSNASTGCEAFYNGTIDKRKDNGNANVDDCKPEK